MSPRLQPAIFGRHLLSSEIPIDVSDSPSHRPVLTILKPTSPTRTTLGITTTVLPTSLLEPSPYVVTSDYTFIRGLVVIRLAWQIVGLFSFIGALGNRTCQICGKRHCLAARGDRTCLDFQFRGITSPSQLAVYILAHLSTTIAGALLPRFR